MPEIKCKIKQLREKEGITQLELAKLLGVTETTIANWESGRSSVNWIDKTIKLTLIFHCNAEDLIIPGEDKPSV